MTPWVARSAPVRGALPLLAIVLLGWGLALARLGERSLWADEAATAVQAGKTDSLMAATLLHKDYHLLHLALEMGIVRLSRTEYALRFPSALAGTLALPVVYALGARLFSRAAGLVGSLLLAISPFAIYYAQEARSYALFELFACLSLLLLLMALSRRRWTWWLAFAAGTTMLLYTHFFGGFVVVAEVLFALVVTGHSSLIERRLDRRLVWLVLSLAAIAVLYLPLGRMLPTLWQQHGPGQSSLQGAGLYPFQLAAWFFRGMLTVFGGRAPGWGAWLYKICLVLGCVSLVVRLKWNALTLVLLWLAVPLVGLAAVGSQHFFDLRYFIFILPIFLLVTAEGISYAVSLLVKVGQSPGCPPVQPVLALGLALLLFVPANWPALSAYHRSEKENWRGIAGFIGQNFSPDEAVYISPKFWANPLLFYRPSVEPYLVGGYYSVEALARAAEQYAGLWYLRHVDPIGDPKGELTAWVTAQKFDLLIDGYACGTGIHVFYRRMDELAPERQADLVRRAADFCPSDPRFQSPPE